MRVFCLISPMFFTKFLSYNYNILRLNNYMQIRGDYSIFNYNKEQDIFRYGSKRRRNFKRLYYKRGDVEDHHIIPKEFGKGTILHDINSDVACSNNILIMPSLKIRDETNNLNIIYHYSHRNYNNYVRDELNDILNKDKTLDDKMYYFWLFFTDLEKRLIKNDKSLPWN